MNYNQQQKIGLIQKFSLTTQMRHSIQLLGMSMSELNEYIDTVISTNPLLEKEQSSEAPFKTNLSVSKKSAALHSGPEDTDIEQDITPQSDLMFQIRMLDLDPADLEIAEYLVYEMDENGYIKVESEEAAENLCVDVEEVEKVIEIIQKLDPPGIGARDIRECLQLQLERRGEKDSIEYRIVTEFLSLVAINDIISISRALGTDKNKIKASIDNIKTLNPRPGGTLLGKNARQVIPDLVATVENKKIRLEINRGAVSKLRIYNPYTNELDIVKDPETREFLQKHTKEANQLLDNIKRREETLCRVAYHILQVQQDHIEQGKTHIKTLTMREISTALNLDVSTISRATSNKYIQINDKVVSLRSLISHGMQSNNGEKTSKTYIKATLKELVENEDKSSPMSDAALMKELERLGIIIKRRTVAKYRESINILPTYLRKKVM